jgi:membrane dipeptidase
MASAGDPALEHALAFLERVPLIDGHNDLPWVIHAHQAAKGNVAVFRPDIIHDDHDTDLPRLRDGKVAAQFWASFIPTRSPYPGRRVLEVMDVILQMEEQYGDTLLPARAASDVEEAKKQGKIASFITVEGGVGLENSLSPLRVWFASGMRLMTLCHNETLDWVDSATDVARHDGLTAFGIQVVLELNRLGVIVDLAHTTPAVMHQVLDISRAPPVISHGNAFAMCDHPRNVPDDVLDRIKGKGALVMPTFVPSFLSQANRDWWRPLQDGYGKGAPGLDQQAIAARINKAGPIPKATLGQFCDHLEYFVQRVGIDHVGIGSDYYGGPVPEGLEHVGRFPYLFAELIRRGWSDDSLAALASGNFLRVFREVERVSQPLRRAERPRVGRVEDFD